jgi:hypothetical protein
MQYQCLLPFWRESPASPAAGLALRTQNKRFGRFFSITYASQADIGENPLRGGTHQKETGHARF